jgi:uncharacterized LabA/DUF88 family protein
MANSKNFIPPKNKNDLTAYLSSLIKGKKTLVLIDAANLYHAAGVANLKIDFTKIVKWFKSNSEVLDTKFYTAFDPEDKKQTDFLNFLEKKGYTVVKKPIKVYEKITKGNMDIEIAVDAMHYKNDYDILILISGDGDFHYLLKSLEEEKKKTIIISVGGFTSYELHQDAAGYFFFNRISKVWQEEKRKKKTSTKKTESSKEEPPEPKESKSSKNSGKNKDAANSGSKKVRPPIRVKVKLDSKKPKIII